MLIMSGSFTILIYPHQRLRHLRPAVDGLADAVTRLYGQDMSALCWSECREGTLARFEGGCPEMAARIPSAKLDCAALLLYLQEGGGWGYQLCFRGSVEDTFTAGETLDTTPPERHAARLVRRFRTGREKLLPWLTQGTGEGSGSLEGFLRELAPWAWEALSAGKLERLDRRDGALSATARMGVWSCAGLRFSQERYQQLLDIWQLN